MADEAPVSRAVAFFDGQNLYRHAKDAFGHRHPNFDPRKLFDAVCADREWTNRGVRFHTGTPSFHRSEMWHGYWANRLLAMRRAGIAVESRPIRYRKHEIPLPGGLIDTWYEPQEKGIDLRLGLDVVRLARGGHMDVAVIFSQDQDLAEAAKDVAEIARESDRPIKVVSAYPVGPSATAKRAINNTEWFGMDREFYDACLDPRDYRPKKFRP